MKVNEDLQHENEIDLVQATIKWSFNPILSPNLKTNCLKNENPKASFFCPCGCSHYYDILD